MNRKKRSMFLSAVSQEEEVVELGFADNKALGTVVGLQDPGFLSDERKHHYLSIRQ